MNIEIVRADYSDARHSKDLVFLLDNYAQDPMGGAKPLADAVKSELAAELAKIPHAFSVLCYVDNEPAGLINAFEAFSTFNCKPLINIHDVTVLHKFRGLGVSQLMLNEVEEIAKSRGCCKVTLEVLDGNKVARNAYLKNGFEGYELDPVMGKAHFWQKTL